MPRKILQKILSEQQFEKIKESSKQWFSICTKCGYSVSVWDSGGIRFGAASKDKRVLGFCPDCGKKRFFRLEKRITEK